MRKLNLVWLLAALLALLPVIAYGAASIPKGTGPGANPGGGFAGSPHDFTFSSSTGLRGACTRCHTPHVALGTRLLWNHTLSKNASFSWSDVTETMGGTKLPTINNATWTGPTKYCLSCHDGSVSTGDINWWKGGKPACPGTCTGIGGGAGTSAINVGFGGSMNGNHPVAVPYPFGQVKNTYNSTTTGDGLNLTEYAADPTADGIRLFNDTGSSGVVAGTAPTTTGMECTSCHEVHNGSAVQDEYLLRGELHGSAKPYLCLKCHLKP
jgi:hypothetical protein